jgi:uncharacterized membrane protein YkoI
MIALQTFPMPYRLLISLLVALSLLTGAQAQADDDRAMARKLHASGEILSLESILEKARAQKAGEVLEIELDRKGSAYVYEIEILDASGQVWELEFDAKTGHLLKTEQDD